MEMLKTDQMNYVEKHRVYEMFRNLVKALVVYQPGDHLRFIAWYVKHKRHADVPKIILVAPPRLNKDKVYIALNIAKSTGVVTIDRRNVLHRRDRKRNSNGCSTDFMVMLAEYMRAKGATERGWILLGIPNSKEEADKLISLGILPTHTIVLTASEVSDKITLDELNQRYKNLEFEIKMKFRFTLKELRVNGIDEATELCLEQILYQKSCLAPFIPKITIVGPKGSRRFETASAISKKFNIVHVDFDQILVQKNVNDDNEILTETMHSWLKEKLTENDCVEKGYILTGFPRTRPDFEWLDSTAMAPNRVIFLAIDFVDIYTRLKNRCVNRTLGTFMSLDRAAEELKSGNLKLEHVGPYPLNSANLFCEFKTYSDRLKDMLYYCGNNCYVVEVDESLYDNVSACIARGSPAAGPRPRNCMPSRLTERLNEKMLMSHKKICQRFRGLSEDAQKLSRALERKNRNE